MTKGEVFLLDSNVLIAMATPDHTEHVRASRWFANCQGFATCPITQGALIRFHLRWTAQPSVQAAKSLLRRICALPSHEFWADTASYLDLPEKGVVGHRQPTDAYLVLLARTQGGRLVTLDQGLAAVHKDAILIS